MACTKILFRWCTESCIDAPGQTIIYRWIYFYDIKKHKHHMHSTEHAQDTLWHFCSREANENNFNDIYFFFLFIINNNINKCGKKWRITTIDTVNLTKTRERKKRTQTIHLEQQYFFLFSVGLKIPRPGEKDRSPKLNRRKYAITIRLIQLRYLIK